MGSEPVKVYGIGGLDFYGRKKNPSLRCQQCQRMDCPYRVDYRRFQIEG